MTPVTDLTARLSKRLDRLDNHLAYVLSIHLFVEYLIDRLIEKEAQEPSKILKDHRSYTFSVKLTLVYNMKLIGEHLHYNITRLNSLRNEYAHNIDVNLASRVIAMEFVSADGKPILRGGRTRDEIERDPEGEGFKALSTIREVTFELLHDRCMELGVSLSNGS